jgi:hypothetical protein
VSFDTAWAEEKENIVRMGNAKADPNERARQYRARAEECLRLSESGRLPAFEVQYLRQVAECYSELALAEEKRITEHSGERNIAV